MNTSLPVDKSVEEHPVNLQKVNYRGCDQEGTPQAWCPR